MDLRWRRRLLQQHANESGHRLAGAPGERPVTVLLTYTALLDLRAELARRGAVSATMD